MNFSRRQFQLALAAAVSNPLRVLAQAKATGVFSLGIASGEPTPDGILLWTRFAPKEAAQYATANVPVRWEVASDEGFKSVVRKNTAMATPGLNHSVHIDVAGLKPGREYFYRFIAGGERSVTGRFKTAPAAGTTPKAFRFASASCQQWTQGLWTAYRHMAEEDLDLVVHLGDYIYERSGSGNVRPEGREEIFTLDDYRRRYALYKSDANLQAAHARFAWVTTWDDHEVSNNYAKDVQEKGQPVDEFLSRRAQAYQAYYENMPLRRAAMPSGPNMRLHRRVDFGSLIRLHMLDTRQYRSDQPCNDGVQKVCEAMNNPAQTMLGPEQEQWLAAGVAESKARWNVLGQGVFVTYQDFDATADEQTNMDSWSGYPLARKRLVETLATRNDLNAVILTGDVHSSWGAQLHTEPLNVKSRCVAAEFVSTSISSAGDGVEMTDRAEKMLPVNPQVRYFNGRRGYLRYEVTADSWRTDYRGVDYVSRAGAPIMTKASFRIEPGKLTLEKV